MDLSNNKLRSLVIFTLKLFLSGGILYILISITGIHTIIGFILRVDPLAFTSAAGLYIFSIFISSLRWSLLINQKVRQKSLFTMYMIGSFFNICLPGIIGGDAVKAYYLNRELKNVAISEDNKQYQGHNTGITAIASVFMDRYLGFWALIIIGMMAFPFGLKYIKTTQEGAFLIWLMPLLFIVFIFGSMVIFWLRAGERFRVVLKIYEYFDLYKAKRKSIYKAFVLSIVIQLINVFSVYIITKGLSLEIPLLPLFVFLPIIITVSIIPLSISGLGLREFAFVVFLGSVGVPSGVSIALSLCWFFSIVVASMLGLILYIFYKNSNKQYKKVH